MKNAEIKKAELEKLRAEITKLNRESEKVRIETCWYPMVASAAMAGAILGILKLFL